MNATNALKMRSTLKIDNPVTCMEALKNGDAMVKLSAVVMGLGNMAHKQVAKGLLFLAAEVAYIVFMITNGFHNLAMLPSLGSVEQQEFWNEELQIFEYTRGDQSILLLLYGLATILLTGVMFWIWRGTLKSGYAAQLNEAAGRHINTLPEDIKELFDSNLYRLLMTPPMFFISILTILTLIFMICMAFTNYRQQDRQPSGPVRLGGAAKLLHPVRLQLGAGLHLLACAGLDAGLGLLRHLHQLLCRHDPCHHHQPQGHQGQGLLAVLLRAALRRAHVRLPADHAHHAAA